jgi:hypothetical protein
MGNAYQVALPTYETLAELASKGYRVQPVPEPGRFPSPREIRTVLDVMDNASVTYNVGEGRWSADVLVDEGDVVLPDAHLMVVGYKGDENTPLRFFFEKGVPSLNLRILYRISEICGPLLLLPQFEAPILVSRERTEKELLLQVE